MKKIDVFFVECFSIEGEAQAGTFSRFFYKEEVAKRVSKGNGVRGQDAIVLPKTLTIFDSVDEFVAETGINILSEEEEKKKNHNKSVT